MLTHSATPSDAPPRAVVIGAGGFVGASCVEHLRRRGIETLAATRNDVDLAGPEAVPLLSRLLRPGDAVVFAAARAPCKEAAMMLENLRMAETVCSAIHAAPPSLLVYVSSDAVYRDSSSFLNEDSCAEPASVHGAMHLAREVLLRSEHRGPLAIVRPTLIYGSADPHNGYGPNRFRRLAAEGRPIVLFGEGEERRDHVHVDDVGSLVAQIVQCRSHGILNAVSGSVVSFRELAELTVRQFPIKVTIAGSPRNGPMPHGGYRAFDASEIRAAFPDFSSTHWHEGVIQACRSPSK